MFGALGAHTRELITYQGRPIVGEQAELAYLFGRSARIVSVTKHDLTGRSPLPPITVTEWLADQGVVENPFQRGGTSG